MTEIEELAAESKEKIPAFRLTLQTLAVSLVVFGLTAGIYWSACKNGFVNWDDNRYVEKQPNVLNGIRWSGVLWASTAEVVGHWHPLTLISLQLDAQLFGSGPAGFHRTAVLIHAVNVALAFLAIYSLTGRLWRSLIIAALFAIHPMRVESVAWISARKDVLSGFFFWLTILAYVRYAHAPSLRRLALVTLCHALGLCSKSMLVTTPCILLLLDFWPLGRLKSFSTTEMPRLRGLIAEKIPLFVLSACTSAFTVAYQRPAMADFVLLPLGTRFKNAVAGYTAYVLQSIWPTGLSPFYAIREIPMAQFSVSLALLVALSGLSIWQWNRRPYLLIGWLWFLGMVVPVCGLTQVGPQARADRYMYLSQFGLFVAVVWAGADFVECSRRGKIILSCLAAIFLTGCGFITVQQIAFWRNPESLWRRAYALDTQDYLVIQQHLIQGLFYGGKKVDALQFTHEMLDAANEADCDQMVMLAMLLATQGDHEACVATLSKALKYHPEKAELYSNRGKALSAIAKWTEAVDDYRQALKLSPRSPSFHFYLAHALGKIGRSEESREIFEFALSKAPDWPQMAVGEAWRQSTSSDVRERVDYWPVCLAEQAVEATRGGRPQYFDVLAAAYAHAGRFNEAIVTARLAIQLADRANQPAFASKVRNRLSLYEQHQPFREISRYP